MTTLIKRASSVLEGTLVALYGIALMLGMLLMFGMPVPVVPAIVVIASGLIGYYDFLGLTDNVAWVLGALCLMSVTGVRDHKFGYAFIVAEITYVLSLAALFGGWYLAQHGFYLNLGPRT